MQFSFSNNVPELFAALDDVTQKQVPQAITWALNDMAQKVLEGVKQDMDAHLDRPTTWTKNAFMVWRATKRTLSAEVKERPSVSKRHYLKMQERGGARGATGFEGRMQAAAKQGPIQAVIPGEHAKLDANGNWSKGERNQVLSQLGVGRDVGYSSNQSTASKKRSGAKRATYFVPERGLAPGVYKRTKPGDAPLRVLKFTDKAPSYQPRLGFLEGAGKRVSTDFATYYARSLERALATAK